MHFLGGIWIGLIIYFIFSYSEEDKIIKTAPLLPTIAILTLLVGISWEWFEIKNWLVHQNNNYAIDTLSDLFFDMVGAGFSYILILGKYNLPKII